MGTTPDAINIRVDAGRVLGALPHNWNYIGYDEINYTYTPEGRELLDKFGALPDRPYYVRTHHLFCTGNCHGFYKWGSTNAYLEDDDGNPVYNWEIVDFVLDTILQSGGKPFVELGFMPQPLADPQHYDQAADNWVNGNYRAYGFASPPKDYQKWHDLVFELARHCLDRYGIDELRTWYWELWNEPDLDYYWRGSIEAYNQLYDYTAAAIKAVSPQLRVGGPGTTNPIQGARSAGVSGQVSRSLCERDQRRDRAARYAAGFRQLSRQGRRLPGGSATERPNSAFTPADFAPPSGRLRDHRPVSRLGSA